MTRLKTRALQMGRREARRLTDGTGLPLIERRGDTCYYRIVTCYRVPGVAGIHADDRKILAQLRKLAREQYDVEVYPKPREGYDGRGGFGTVWMRLRHRDWDTGRWRERRKPDSSLLDLLAHEVAHCVAGVDAHHGPRWKKAYADVKARFAVVTAFGKRLPKVDGRRFR